MWSRFLISAGRFGAQGLALLAAAILVASAAQGRTTAPQDQEPPSIQELEALRQALGPSAAEDQPELSKLYEEAIGALKRASEARTRATAFEADAATAPQLIEQYRAEFEAPAPTPQAEDFGALTLEQLESRFQQAQAELAAAKATVIELEGLAEFRGFRMGELPAEISVQQAQIVSTIDAVAALGALEEDEPKRLLLRAQLEEQRALLASLEAERNTYEVRRELLPLRRDRALRAVTIAERSVETLRGVVHARRTAEAEAAARRAGEQFEAITKSYPALLEVAARNRSLTEMRTGERGLPRRIAKAQEALKKERALLEETSRRSRGARKRIGAGGLTEGMATILRRDYEWLTSEAQLRRAMEVRGKLLSDAQLEMIPLEEERAAHGDVASATERLLGRLGMETPDEKLRETARELVSKQRLALDAAINDLATLNAAFIEHRGISTRLLQEVGAYRSFIEKRILWVRSTGLNPLESLLRVPVSGLEILNRMTGYVGPTALLPAIQEHLPQCLLVSILMLLLVGGRRYLRRKRREMGLLARSYRTDNYLYTVRALVQTILIALPWPMLTWFVGWLLSPALDDISQALGSALREIGVAWLMLRTLYCLAPENGVGQMHFKWPASTCETLRSELRWFEPVGLLLGLVVLTLDRQNVAVWSDSVGRLCFVLLMIALSVLMHRLFDDQSRFWAIHPKTGKGLLGKTHRIWSLLASGMPLGLAVIASLGYYYTALQLELRFRYSIALALSLVLANAMLFRWLFMARRRLAVSQALEARARKLEAEPQGATESGAQQIDADKLDIPAANAQTRQLFKSSIIVASMLGLYFVWASVLPALQGLDRVQLLPSLAILAPVEDAGWPELSVTNGVPNSTAATQPVGMPLMTPSSALPEGEVALGLPSNLTLDEVLIALVFLILTLVAAKNLPALLELSLLQRLPLDGGARYAVSTLARYLILMIGLGAVSGAVGIGWQQVQWLAAALTFGLAFGLQEIFANFVSGLIILFERPIRVGDIVTVSGVEGRVTELRMRATTIQDFDRRELLVPNKEFITGSIVNWTLTDPVTRIIIKVGIAYGSDTVKAKKLLLQAASTSALILKDPEPQVVFRYFGESSLDFEVRIFITNRDFWPEATDCMHMAIDAAFRKAGIEIAFPQRDLHLRSAAGLQGLGGFKTPEGPG